VISTLQRAARMAGFDRRVATELMFDTSAMGDAVLLVAGIHVVIGLVASIRGGFFDVVGLLTAAIYGVAGWLILSFAVWIMGTRVLKASGDVQALMRGAGFGSLPLLLAVVGLAWVGTIWHLAVVVLVTRVVLGLEWKEAAGAVLLGAALVVLIQLLFRAPFLLL
jgi:Yip1 domain